MDRLIETRHTAAANFRHITLPGGQHSDGSWLFLPQSAGGSIALPGQGARQLQWQLQTHNVSTLSLAEVSVTHGQIGRGLHLQIEEQVFPALAAHIDRDAQQLQLCLVLASKAVAVLTLPLAAPATARSSSNSILDRVGMFGDAGSWHVVQCKQHLASLQLPSALAVADGHLCITGSSGLTTCISLELLQSGGLQELPTDSGGCVFTLDPSSLISHFYRRIGLAACTPAVAAVAVDVPAAQHSSLLVVHEDGSCHQWLVGQHRQGLSTQLTPAAVPANYAINRVCVCYPQPAPGSRAPSWDAVLVFDGGSRDRGAQSDLRVLPLRLQRDQDTPRLEPLLQQPQQLQLELPDASLIDARVVGQQLLVLCGTASGGSCMVTYSIRDWSYQGPCLLLQQKAAEWGGPQEVWSAALAAFPANVDPATHVLSQLLVPGQLCDTTLRQTLAYFGAQLGEAELAGSSLGQLKACITAAVQLVQSRNPTYSAARCWHMLFAKYCETWQQLHPMMALWAGAEGWVGVVRAGGLLTVLRKATAAEALGQESKQGVLQHVMEAVGVSGSSSGVVGGAAGVAKLRVCLDSVGDVLGLPALRVMTQLVMAGVPVESQLLPAFVQLLLQGPPLQQHQQPGKRKAAGSGFGEDSGSSSARQQQLLAWRQQRQARLLAVHSQLSELPHVLESLSGFADLAILAASQAAAQLQVPAPAAGSTVPLALNSLLSCVALHSLRATATTLQKLLLLLGYMSHIGSVGSAPLTAADHAAIAADLITPVATALRSVAAALWLCKTPASTPVPGLLAGTRGSTGLPGPLPSLRGAPAPDTPRDAQDTSGSSAGAGSWRYSLAAHLLPSFWQQQHLAAGTLSGPGLSTAAMQLSAWLVLGAETAEAAEAATAGIISPEAWFSITGRARGSGQGSGPGVHAKSDRALRSTQGLAGRAVLVGYRLFMAREYAAMQQLVRLVGGESPSEPGLQYVLGLSIACGMHSSKDAAQARLDAAVGHLFRAAAGLCGSQAGPLRLVLQLLRQQQHQEELQASNRGLPQGDATGAAAVAAGVRLLAVNGDMGSLGSAAGAVNGAAAAAQQQQQEAMLRLQFDKAVMVLFEQRGVKEGALAFARAALSVVEEAYAPHQQQEKQQQQAQLWASVFDMAFDLGQVEDAYTAALANPQHDIAEDKVKRLVLALVDQGQLQKLLNLPWAGVLQLKRDSMTEPVPVVEVVIDRLVSSACFSHQQGLSLKPLAAYQVLYDFLLAWGNCKHAAAAMLAFARRLRAAAVSAAAGAGAIDRQQLQLVVAEVQAAYDVCISLLQSLDARDAWIDPMQRLLQPYQAPAPLLRANRRSAAPPDGSSGSPFIKSAQQTKQQQQQQAPGSSGVGLTGEQALQQQQRPPWERQQPEQQQQPGVLSLAALQQEAAVFVAAVALHSKGAGLEVRDLMGHSLDVSWLFDQLVGQGLFAEALALAHATSAGQQLLQQLEAVAGELAGQCADMQAGGRSLQDSVQLQEGMGDSSMFDGVPSKAAASLKSSVLPALGPSYLRSGAAPAWAKLRRLLEAYDTFDCLSAGASASALPAPAATAGAAVPPDGSSNAGGSNTSGITLVGARLRLAAVDGILTVEPRMALPDWLLQPFKPADGAAGMAGSAADPAALLQKLMEHSRLLDATEHVLGYLDAWRQQSSLDRVQSTAVWLPLKDLELLHASLQDGARRAKESGAAAESALLGSCAEGLQEKLKRHVDQARNDWGQLQLAAH